MNNNALVVRDVCDRTKLSEGRNYQMGFAFCKMLLSGEFETVQPLSPCKDYLNDVVYTEHTGKSFSACGLATVKHGIFDSAPHAYLAIKILRPKGGGWPCVAQTFEMAQAELQKNYKNIEKLLNHVEAKFSSQGLDERTAISPTQDEHMFLLAVPLWWCRTTHLISLYSLFVRMAQFWDGTGTADAFLENYKNPLDLQLWAPAYGRTAKGNYSAMLKHGIKIITPEELFDRNPSAPNVHSNGILAY